FAAAHPRNPYPDTLTWETADLTHNRASWLIIDKLGAPNSGATQMSDVNLVDESESLPGFFQISGTLFSGRKPSGRVDLVRTGNTILAATRGVASLTLLLSSDVFDFSQPIKVVANGRNVFDGRLKPNVETLMKWAARDNDRT